MLIGREILCVCVSIYANMHLLLFTDILYIVSVQINNLLRTFIAIHGYFMC